MSIKQWNMVLVVVFLVVLSGGGFVLYQNHLVKLEAAAQVALELEAKEAAAAKIVEEKALRLAGLSKEFEGFLNGFLKEVFTEAKDYKANRRVLLALIAPENLGAPDYVAENYTLGETTLMRLRLQMDKVLGIFEQAEVRFQALLVQWPEDRRAPIAESWQGIKDQQVNLYLAYFSSEEDVLGAVQALLSFYYENRALIKVEQGLGRIFFDDLENQNHHMELKTRLEALVDLQAELLSQE